MTKVQFGSGPNQLNGWINLQENNGDITKPLKFGNDTVDFILIEHCLEHVSHQDAWSFLREAHRILKPGGVIRVIVPDTYRIWSNVKKPENPISQDYLNFIHSNLEAWSYAWASSFPPFQGDVTDKHWKNEAMWAIIFLHGHKSCWTEELLFAFLESTEFTAQPTLYGHSSHPELNDVDSHYKLMGRDRCILESVVAEGTKL